MLLAHIISLAKFKNTFLNKTTIIAIVFTNLFICQTWSKSSYQFEFGDKVHVISDKAFRVTKENTFEAIGNVIIKFGNNSTYGERAKISFATGDVEVEGNVRYISNELTMYGTHFFYNTNTKQATIKNARVLNENYVVLGKELKKVSEDLLIGEDAEYTTCKDCPESWSIFGKKIEVTVGEYVKIQHAFLKTKGVVLMYFPYIIFPIKKERESGLLFPSLGFNYARGVKLQQPVFWAISQNQDMTITPSIWGRRGLGGEFEYRYYLTDSKWMEMHSLLSNDQVYAPGKVDFDPSEKSTFRHFTDYEHHISHGLNFNHHLWFEGSQDLDMVRDFDFRIQNQLTGSDLGAETFFDYRFSLFNVSTESHFKRNLFYSKATEFDHSYVQVLPKVSLSSIPFNLINTDLPMLNSVSLGFDADYTLFKQNHFSEDIYVRNAHRLNLNPYVNWNFGNIAGVNVNHNTVFDYQGYEFPFKEEKTYYKRAFIHKTSAVIELDKIFGVAYRDKEFKQQSQVDTKKENNENDGPFVGALPPYNPAIQDKFVEVQKNSYRHTQSFELNHYLLTGIEHNGNDPFHQQLLVEAGQFDIVDSFREKEYEASETDYQVSLPLRNTIELQWNNSLIEKTAKSFNYNTDNRYLVQNFDYRKIAYFNISQGYNLDKESDTIREKLTRLYISSGLSLNDFSVSGSEYYFYNNQKHVFSINFTRNIAMANVSTGFQYDSRTNPVKKLLTIAGNVHLSSIAQAYANYEYDIEAKSSSKSHYGLIYTPENNCWKVDVKYEKSLIDDRLSFNFMIKFNDKYFGEF